MDLQPKSEPGLPPVFVSRISTNLNEMSVSDLVTILRTAYQFDEFDNVEKVLVARDAGLRVDIASLQEKIEVERMAKILAEEELKKRVEQCLKGKRAQEYYEKLMKEVKQSRLAEMNTELRNQNQELLAENFKLKELKKQWLDDSKVLAELRVRVRELENERVELEARKKKNWEDDKSALDSLKRINSELEEALKKNLAENENDKSAIDELRSENTRLLDEKRGLVALVESKGRKFLELEEKLVKLEDDVKLLKSADNTEVVEPKAEPQELKELNEMDVRGCIAGSNPFQRNEYTGHSLGANIVQSRSKVDKGAPGASATGRSGLVNNNIIEILSDDDDDDQIHRRQKRIEMLKRKISFF